MSTPVLEIAPSLGSERPVEPRVVRAGAPHSTAWALVMLASDLCAFVAALALAASIGQPHLRAVPSERLLVGDAIYVALWVLLFERLGLYRRLPALSMKDELYFTVTALTIGVIPQLLLFTFVPAISTSRFELLYSLALSILAVGGMRTILHEVRKLPRFRQHQRVVIVGRPDRLRSTRDALTLPAYVQVLPIESYDPVAGGGPSFDRIDLAQIPWLRRARAWHCDTLVLTEMPPPEIVPHLLDLAMQEQFTVAFAPEKLQCQSYSLSLRVLGRQALVVPSRLAACTPHARFIKRLLDLSVTSLALVVFAPVMALAALAILIDSGRPIFFRQERVGLGGKPFSILKFRSMKVDAEAQTGAVWVRPNDDRCTRVGRILRRLSFDELPQLWNVLRGDMSLIGPRPERPVFVHQFRTQYARYDERHLVRPGLSGLSQLQMRRLLKASDLGQKLTFDLYYIEEWSIFLDLSLLFRTATEFLFQRAG
ncbi:MAG TPA: sugar transferase [Candidatus Tumulicola sp.]|nr:sugar transferase [Candidatus Tumulicola sp.]